VEPTTETTSSDASTTTTTSTTTVPEEVEIMPRSSVDINVVMEKYVEDFENVVLGQPSMFAEPSMLKNPPVTVAVTGASDSGGSIC
jgi:hypothetical protein